MAFIQKIIVKYIVIVGYYKKTFLQIMDIFLISLGLLILFFAIGRELICWYFKINKIVTLLEDISASLQKISSK